MTATPLLRNSSIPLALSGTRIESSQVSDMTLAACVALIGCDGAGKSTLAAELAKQLNRHTPTRSVYLGLGTGDLGRSIGRLPLIGRLAERYLSIKADRAHHGSAMASRGSDKRLPGLATALVMFGLSLARRRRFKAALACRRQGIQVVADRYPQAEVAGSFDGPGLAWSRRGSYAVEQLAQRERALYRHMAAIRPTVIIRLNVDVDTALARKPDHRRGKLERKLEVVPKLVFGGAPIVDVDATLPYPEVLAAVVAIVRRHGIRV